MVYVDAENWQTPPQDLMSRISEHNGSKPSETYAYSKWSANSAQTKKYRSAGFRLQQADSGDNNADIMMCLDAYQRVRDLSDNGMKGNVYICFHGDKGFTHLLEKLRTINGWKSIWVTSNTKPNKMIENSASVTLRVPLSQNPSIKKSMTDNKDALVSVSGKSDTEENSELREIMLQLIGKEELKSTLLGLKIIEYQKSNGWRETGKQAFNQHFGLPKNQSYLATISKHLSNELEILGEGAAASYKAKFLPQSLQKESNKKSMTDNKDALVSVSGKNFKRIIGFNNSGKGLRLPLNPETLANILILNSEFEEDIPKNERIDIIFEELGVGRSRVDVVISRLVGLNLIKTKSPLEAFEGLRLRLESHFKEHGKWTSEDIEDIQRYFEKARELLE